MSKGYEIARRLEELVPGGAHTYSRGKDQFPSNAPPVLQSGTGGRVRDLAGTEFVDFGMALRSVAIGYAEPEIDDAAIAQIRNGNNLTRATPVELCAAEAVLSCVPNAEMVKFTKSGSAAVSAAVKLARAYTGKEIVVRCAQHPFFSFDDWFIGSTVMNRGVPNAIRDLTKTFEYNDIDSLREVLDDSGPNVACVVMEGAAGGACPCVAGDERPCCQQVPCARKFIPGQQTNFLQAVQEECRSRGVLFILDEMITGFRWGIGGAQSFFGIDPDLSTWGKALANGYSVAAVTGKRDIMKIAGIDEPEAERVFLLSATHGAEMSGLGACVATIRFMQREDVSSRLWEVGDSLRTVVRECVERAHLGSFVELRGPACSPVLDVRDRAGDLSPGLRTLLMQELVRHGVLAPWIATCFRHSDADIQTFAYALDKALLVIGKALDGKWSDYLEGDPVKPVFRRFN